MADSRAPSAATRRSAASASPSPPPTAAPWIAATIGVLRLLPLAYGAYVIAALALPLSYPVRAQPLMSLPRFLMGSFPYAIAGGMLLDRIDARLRAALLGLCAFGLVACMWATYHGSGLAP